MQWTQLPRWTSHTSQDVGPLTPSLHNPHDDQIQGNLSSCSPPPSLRELSAQRRGIPLGGPSKCDPWKITKELPGLIQHVPCGLALQGQEVHLEVVQQVVEEPSILAAGPPQCRLMCSPLPHTSTRQTCFCCQACANNSTEVRPKSQSGFAHPSTHSSHPTSGRIQQQGGEIHLL